MDSEVLQLESEGDMARGVEDLSKLDRLKELHNFEQLLEERKILADALKAVTVYMSERERLDQTIRKYDQGKVVQAALDNFRIKLDKAKDLI